VATVTHHADEGEHRLWGRHWRGGLLSGGSVASPCDPAPEPKLVFKPSTSLPPGVVLVRVLDEDGITMPGALVKVGPSSGAAPTDLKGEVRFGPFPAGTYQVVVKMDAFDWVNANFELQESGEEVEITMRYAEMW
jgi:hypothetical protein